MSELSQPQQTAAEQLGLVDGQFMVKRSDETLQQGWNVMAIREVPDPNNADLTRTKVDIVLPGATDEDTLVKPGIDLETLRSWQPAEDLDADTIPRLRLIEIGAGPVEQVVEEPAWLEDSKALQDNTSGTVLPIEVPLDVVRPDHGVDVDKSATAGEPSPEQPVLKAEVKPQEGFEPKPFEVADIAERLGLPREAEATIVATKLNEQLDQLDGITRSLNRFAGHGRKAANEINMTLTQQRNHLTGSSRTALNEYLGGEFALVRELAQDESKLARMPAPIRRAIEGARSNILGLSENARVMMGGNMSRNLIGAFDETSAPSVATALRNLDSIRKQAQLSRTIIEDELTHVIGLEKVNDERLLREALHAPVPKLEDVLRLGERMAETGALWVRGELREQLIAALGEAAQDAPSPEEVSAGVSRARGLVADGNAGNVLARMPFMSGRQLKDSSKYHRVEAAVFLDEPLYVSPDRIIGAEGFNSWMGRGTDGTGDVSTRDGKAATIRSIDQIKDYATRETQLKTVGANDRITVVQADNGVFLYSNSAHRSAAAKLRGEPLGVDALEVYKYDGAL